MLVQGPFSLPDSARLRLWPFGYAPLAKAVRNSGSGGAHALAAPWRFFLPPVSMADAPTYFPAAYAHGLIFHHRRASTLFCRCFFFAAVLQETFCQYKRRQAGHYPASRQNAMGICCFQQMPINSFTRHLQRCQRTARVRQRSVMSSAG